MRAGGWGGGSFCRPVCLRAGDQPLAFGLGFGDGGGGGGLLARARTIPFQQVVSSEVQGKEHFSEAWKDMRGHLATFRASALGADVIDLYVVSDGEVTEGGGSDGGRSASGRGDRSARSGVGKGKKRAAKDNNPPLPKSWRRLVRAKELQPHRRKRL